MINGEGRLQRLNRAVRGPGQARDDWEILRDLIQACSGPNSIYSIEDVFRQMAEAVPRLAGLSLSKLGDLGIQVMEAHECPPPPVDPAAGDIEKAESKRPPGR
jgi:NADH-quinone oxidoreductase subunit G